MPVVAKTAGGRVYARVADREFRPGETYTVDDDVAEYLLEHRDDFEIATDETDDGDDGPSEGDDGDEAPEPVTHTLEETIEAGTCPWCDEYEGEAVGQHASSAHPDAWADYKEA